MALSLVEAARELQQKRLELDAAEQSFREQYEQTASWVETQLESARRLIATVEQEGRARLAKAKRSDRTSDEVEEERLQLDSDIEKAKADLVRTERELRGPLEEAQKLIAER